MNDRGPDIGRNERERPDPRSNEVVTDFSREHAELEERIERCRGLLERMRSRGVPLDYRRWQESIDRTETLLSSRLTAERLRAAAIVRTTLDNWRKQQTALQEYAAGLGVESRARESDKRAEAARRPDQWQFLSRGRSDRAGRPLFEYYFSSTTQTLFARTMRPMPRYSMQVDSFWTTIREEDFRRATESEWRKSSPRTHLPRSERGSEIEGKRIEELLEPIATTRLATSLRAAMPRLSEPDRLPFLEDVAPLLQERRVMLSAMVAGDARELEQQSKQLLATIRRVSASSSPIELKPSSALALAVGPDSPRDLAVPEEYQAVVFQLARIEPYLENDLEFARFSKRLIEALRIMHTPAWKRWSGESPSPLDSAPTMRSLRTRDRESVNAALKAISDDSDRLAVTHLLFRRSLANGRVIRTHAGRLSGERPFTTTEWISALDPDHRFSEADYLAFERYLEGFRDGHHPPSDAVRQVLNAANRICGGNGDRLAVNESWLSIQLAGTPSRISIGNGMLQVSELTEAPPRKIDSSTAISSSGSQTDAAPRRREKGLNRFNLAEAAARLAAVDQRRRAYRPSTLSWWESRVQGYTVHESAKESEVTYSLAGGTTVRVVGSRAESGLFKVQRIVGEHRGVPLETATSQLDSYRDGPFPSHLGRWARAIDEILPFQEGAVVRWSENSRNEAFAAIFGQNGFQYLGCCLTRMPWPDGNDVRERRALRDLLDRDTHGKTPVEIILRDNCIERVALRGALATKTDFGDLERNWHGRLATKKVLGDMADAMSRRLRDYYSASVELSLLLRNHGDPQDGEFWSLPSESSDSIAYHRKRRDGESFAPIVFHGKGGRISAIECSGSHSPGSADARLRMALRRWIGRSYDPSTLDRLAAEIEVDYPAGERDDSLPNSGTTG